MRIKAYGATDVGKVRSANEDSFLIDEGQNLYIVADGMGGHQGGGYASANAVKKIQEEMNSDGAEQESTQPVAAGAERSRSQVRLHHALITANDHIFQKAMEDPSLRGMGTTVTAIQIDNQQVNVAHVGDSRLYLLRGQDMVQLTKDHSWVQEQVDSGVLTDEEAKNHPLKNIITRSLGHDRELKVDLIRHEYKVGDKLLLCSDGLTNMVDDPTIKQVMSSIEPDAAVKDLIDRALQAGGLDNVTAVLVELVD